MRRLYHQWRQVIFDCRQFNSPLDDLRDLFWALAMTVGALCWGILLGAGLANFIQGMLHG